MSLCCLCATVVFNRKLNSTFSVQNYHSILRKSSREQKSSGKHARLNPLVLALDGALVGELETVQRAMQEVCPSTYVRGSFGKLPVGNT